MQLDVGNEPTSWFAHVTSIILDLNCIGWFKLYGSIIPKYVPNNMLYCGEVSALPIFYTFRAMNYCLVTRFRQVRAH